MYIIVWAASSSKVAWVPEGISGVKLSTDMLKGVAQDKPQAAVFGLHSVGNE
jgi:hypothetical protein